MTDFETVMLDDINSALVIIDQTRLPGEVITLHLTDQRDIREAICALRVRGAPAIGVAAAVGMYLAAKSICADSFDAFYREFKAAKDALAATRPTAVNLFWALNRMEQVVLDNRTLPVLEIKRRLYDEATTIREEDIRVCRAIGEHGLSLLRDGDGILTHCNAGRLAAVKYGTALAPLYVGCEKGYRFRVFADETRPLLQGARLTAFELFAEGIDVTVICDNMAARVMKNGWVQAVVVGADRVAANGDTCNKIGTSGLAILARHYDIPFYVCAPSATIDMNTEKGEDIPIEERAASEISEMWFQERMVLEGVKVYNPAFDVSDNALISAIITEYGIARPPYSESLKGIFAMKKRL